MRCPLLLGLFCLGSTLLPVVAPTRAAVPTQTTGMRPNRVRQVGPYRLVHWRNERAWRERLYIRDRFGKLVASIPGVQVNVGAIRDLTGDGYPEVVIMSWDGGAHSSFAYHIFSLGLRPRCLLAYRKGNGDAGEMGPEDPPWLPDFDITNLDGDGRSEILTWYDGFSSWDYDDWSRVSYAGSARIPLILTYRDGRYVDATHRYRQWLRHRLWDQEGALRSEIAGKNPNGTAQRPHAAIEYYAVARFLHGPARAYRMLARLLPAEDLAHFRYGRKKIEAVLVARSQRLLYPRVYREATVQSPLLPYLAFQHQPGGA